LLIEKVNTPSYQLTLTADEMTRLLRVCQKAKEVVSDGNPIPAWEALGFSDACYFFDILKALRSDDGF
jgi:hypothetical protein